MKAVFLDRDGVINMYPGDFKYVTGWEEFHFIPGVEQALKKLSESGIKLFVISNQAGVSKGLYSKGTLDLITENMLAVLKKSGVTIAGVYYCTHQEAEDCSCRKPKAGLVHKAVSDARAKEMNIDIKNSYFVGDTIRDVEAGKVSGLKTILVFTGKERPENKDKWRITPDFTANTLSDAAEIILK
ncbi:MAG: HAD-IIIA family hydrolase [Candidatus Omnitrophica bacterium]|nr:HAD-IIIA family hydrolase [Candidatus Omnitrophota bacterium]